MELLPLLILWLILLLLLQDRHACVAQLLLHLLLLMAAVSGLGVLLLCCGLLQGRQDRSGRCSLCSSCKRIAMLLRVLCSRSWLPRLLTAHVCSLVCWG